MAYGSITTVTNTWVGPVASGDSYLPIAGVLLLSADSVAHITVDTQYTSGNTGVAQISVFASLGSGAFSADTEWSERADISFSLISTTNPYQASFILNGPYAWRVGVQNSSASTMISNLGYRID